MNISAGNCDRFRGSNSSIREARITLCYDRKRLKAIKQDWVVVYDVKPFK